MVFCCVCFFYLIVFVLFVDYGFLFNTYYSIINYYWTLQLDVVDYKFYNHEKKNFYSNANYLSYAEILLSLNLNQILLLTKQPILCSPLQCFEPNLQL